MFFHREFELTGLVVGEIWRKQNRFLYLSNILLSAYTLINKRPFFVKSHSMFEMAVMQVSPNAEYLKGSLVRCCSSLPNEFLTVGRELILSPFRVSNLLSTQPYEASTSIRPDLTVEISGSVEMTYDELQRGIIIIKRPILRLIPESGLLTVQRTDLIFELEQEREFRVNGNWRQFEGKVPVRIVTKYKLSDTRDSFLYFNRRGDPTMIDSKKTINNNWVINIYY